LEGRMPDLVLPKKIWANSGDSHFVEPEDLFDQALPKALAERMPHSEKFDGYEIITVDGQQFRRPMPKPAHDGVSMGDIMYEKAPGANNPLLRLKDLDNEGIWAEVVYPSIGTWAHSIHSPDLMAAGARAQNDWVASEIMPVSERYVATATVSLLDMDDAVSEIERCAELGFRAVFMPTAPPPPNRPYNRLKYWDRVWSALDANNMVFAIHIGTEPHEADSHNMQIFHGEGGAVLNHVYSSFGGQIATMQLAASGALEKHPNLRVLISEGGATWGPFIADRMDEAYRQHNQWVWPQLSKPPSRYLYEQVYASFQHDATAVLASQYMGWNNVMWGSDYPHLEGTFGHTQKTLHEIFEGVPETLRKRITVGAFQELFPEVGNPPEDENDD
jgi:predicted TIM-barrel fold metal-dependent hydrolase